MTVGPDPAAHQPGLDAVGLQGPHQVLAQRVDLALVLAHLLRRLQQGHGRQGPLAGRPRGCRHHRQRGSGDPFGLDRGLRLGIRLQVDVLVHGVVVGREVLLRVEGNPAARGGLLRSIRAEVVGDHEGLAPPQSAGGPPGPGGGGAERSADRGQRHAGRHQDGHEDDGDEQDGGARRTEAGMQRAADGRAEVAAGVLQPLRIREPRRTLGQLGQRRTRRGGRAACRPPDARDRRPSLRPRRPRRRRSDRAGRATTRARRRGPPAGAGRAPSRRGARGRCRRRDRSGRAARPRGPASAGHRA